MRDTPSPSLLRECLRLLRPFWFIAAMATAMGSASGLATAWLLATINAALHADGGATTALLLTFGGLCGVAVLGEIVSDLGNSFVGQHVVAALRKELADRILAAPIDQLEQVGQHRLTTAFNQDVEVISGFTFAFSSLAIAFAVTAGGLGYLILLSAPMSALAALAIACGSVLHLRAREAGRAGFAAARASQDDLQRHFRAITDGAKELRINRSRRARVRHVQLGGAIDRIRDLRIRAMRIYMTANAFGSLLFFAVIGLLLGLQGSFRARPEVLSGFVLVLLYLKGPLQQLVAALPAFGQAQVALRRVAELTARFSAAGTDLPAGDPVVAPRVSTGIALAGVRYGFPADAGAKGFAIGPIDLEITAGETLFIVGENGSGKTTLIKLLLGLYPPQAGEIRLDGVPVTAANRDDYRQIFSTVFADYYLFEDLPGGTALQEDARPYLERLEIAHKVVVQDGHFSTTDLSTGQRKRLALVHAYLERRPVIVFDEWAADQDPGFRSAFYRDLLPELKRQGHTLIVISHDDRYFDVADSIVHMGDGRITRIVTQTAAAAAR